MCQTTDYVLDFLKMCGTFWWMCRSSHHVSHFRIRGVCHSSYILHCSYQAIPYDDYGTQPDGPDPPAMTSISVQTNPTSTLPTSYSTSSTQTSTLCTSSHPHIGAPHCADWFHSRKTTLCPIGSDSRNPGIREYPYYI